MTAIKGISGAIATRTTGISEQDMKATGENILLGENLSGRYNERTYRGNVYSATNAAFTMPVNAATLATKFALYNPPGSGKLLEIIDVEAHAVVATTVVNAMGVYFSTVALSALATFTTAGTITNGRLGDGTGVATFWSVAVHSGTPVLARLVGGWGAVTDGGATPIRKEFNGSLIVPQGILISLAMTTAASTGSGITAAITWAEIPV